MSCRRIASPARIPCSGGHHEEASRYCCALAGEHRRAGSVHLRIWRPHHPHRSRSRDGFDTRRLRQYRSHRRSARRPRTTIGSAQANPAAGQDRSEDRSANRFGCGSCACSGRTGGGACHPGASTRPCSNGPTVGHDRGCGARRYSDRSACSAGFAGYRAASCAARPPAPTVAAVPPAPAPAPAPVTVQAANSPLGVWLTEEKEGKVRIEQCGGNLCGYAVDKKSNQNGEQVLINMKPGKDAKWSGRILDPNSGSTYDSTIALKGSDTPARSGLRLRRHVLRRPDLDARELSGCPLRCARLESPRLQWRGLLAGPCDDHHGAIGGDVRPCPHQNAGAYHEILSQVIFNHAPSSARGAGDRNARRRIDLRRRLECADRIVE